MQHSPTHKVLNIIVIVAALGYFVDIYDLILFSIVRVKSLESLGITGNMNKTIGLYLLNTQMIGMLLGGILWGVLGDKKGRLYVLFGTILLYSIANIANGMIQTLEQYYVLRFFAGVGLAGELGIGITLVSEVMSKESRGYGTTVVAGVGIAGAIAGYFVAESFDWRMAYYVGGGLGLLLLILRISVYESGMFSKMKISTVKKGSFISLFTDYKRFIKFFRCILVGVPVWYVIGVLVSFSDKIGGENGLNVVGQIEVSKAVMYHYIGASMGAFLTGFISQWLKSRRKALFIALTGLVVSLAWCYLSRGIPVNQFYFILFVIGIPNGFWSVFVTIASEQFGTNLRATVTTTVPNFVRGMTVLVTTAFSFFSSSIGVIASAASVGVVVLMFSFFSVYKLEESYHKDLDYYENV
ncbi:MAG: MFS transporter [Bacteroidetes bacterium]|nr:MFS transporter [Bacteroidota bacterium]